MKIEIAASVATVLIMAAGAAADVVHTGVSAPPSGEQSHRQVFQQVFGGSWSQSGLGYSNNHGVVATRVADGGYGDGLSLAISQGVSITDQVFGGGLAEVIVRAKNAGHSHTVGWVDDDGGSGFIPIAASSDLNNPVNVNFSPSFRFALHDISSNDVWMSAGDANTRGGDTGYDQMVSYRITGHGGDDNRWMFFWEDLFRGGATDNDFNDVVVEVRAIPAPGPAALAAMGLLMLGRSRRRR